MTTLYSYRITHDPDCDNPLDDYGSIKIEHTDHRATRNSFASCSRAPTFTKREDLDQDQVEIVDTDEAIIAAMEHYDAVFVCPVVGPSDDCRVDMDAELEDVTAWAYVTKEQAEEWGNAPGYDWLADITSGVKSYSRWANGECYGYTVTGTYVDEDGTAWTAELDSCWGFIGEEYAIEEAKASIAALEAKR